MRLFATGAMQWVMGRTLPDDVPIEAKMVTKAIERAQNTVEGRNAEIRKDVLKYDEVLNEQRKVIYARRLPDHRRRGPASETTEELLEETIDALVPSACPGEFPEEWELDRLVTEVDPVLPDGGSPSRTWPRPAPSPSSPRASWPRRSTPTHDRDETIPGRRGRRARQSSAR